MTLYSLALTLPGLPATPNARMHHMATYRERKRWKRLVAEAALAKGVPLEPLERAHLTLTRCSSSPGDADNIAASFKGCIDGLKLAGVILDDSLKVIGWPTYGWEKAPPGKGFIKIKVKSCEGEIAA